MNATKAGVKAALISKGYDYFPKALENIKAAKEFNREDDSFADYLVYDNDFGGAWEDNEQINYHLK